MPRLRFPLTAGVPVIGLHVAAPTPGAGAGADAGAGAGVVLRALIDTGAKLTCLDAAAVRSLGLAAVTVTTIWTASTGRSPLATPVYEVSLAISGLPPVALAATVRVAAVDLSWSRYQCLLGRDVLADCRFVYDGPAAHCELEI